MKGVARLFIFLIPLLLGCGVTVKSYDQKNLSHLKVRVEVQNKTYEAGLSYIFKDACEAALFKRGAEIVNFNENLFIEITIKEIKAVPVSFGAEDIATNYNLSMNGSFRVFRIEGNNKKLLLEDGFSSVQNYHVSNVEMTETKRQLSIMQAAYEITEGIKDRVIMLE